MLDTQTVQMFHFSGPKHTTPNCPVDRAPNFNSSSGAQSYRRSTKDCSRNSYYNIPFFLNRPGPKYSEWSVNAHEARAGHHTQVKQVGAPEHLLLKDTVYVCSILLVFFSLFLFLWKSILVSALFC